MPRVHGRLIGKTEEHLADRAQQGGRIAAWKIRSTDRPGKKRVPHEQRPPRFSCFANRKADPPWAMPRRMRHPGSVVSKSPRSCVIEIEVDWWLRLHSEAERHSLLDDGEVQKLVRPVQTHRRTEGLLGLRDPRNVIEMRVRQQDVANGELLCIDDLQQLPDFVSGIDEHGLASSFAGDNVAVLEKRGDRTRLDDHVSLFHAHFRITGQEHIYGHESP